MGQNPWPVAFVDVHGVPGRSRRSRRCPALPVWCTTKPVGLNVSEIENAARSNHRVRDCVSIGGDNAENLNSLRNGIDCVSPVTAFDVSKTRCRTAGQVPNEWLKEPMTRKNQRLDRSSLMMLQATREAIRTAGHVVPQLMVISTSSGGMFNGERFYRSLIESRPRVGAARAVANYMAQKPVLDVQENLVGGFPRKLFPMRARPVPMPLVTLFSWFGPDFMNRLFAEVTTRYPSWCLRDSFRFRQRLRRRSGRLIEIVTG